MATILDTLNKGSAYLEKHGVEDARLNMQQLLAHVLKCDRMQLYVDFDKPIDDAALASLRELTKLRGQGEPLQHLLGTVEFGHLEFKTDSRALVPRPETEELVERLAKLRWKPQSRFIDVGCGSGVIGLSLAYELRELQPTVVLSDVSGDALSLAKENAETIDYAPAQVEWLESNLLEKAEGEFDLIVANLPYIPDNERTALSREVQRDPDLALYGGELGTEIIEVFLKQCPDRLKTNGVVAIEFGIGQENDLYAAAEALGFEKAEIYSDLSEVNRFLFIRNLGKRH
ncbi:MAG: peptide chain release factor N(5)-glutamine methyltransferase [Verrucomicrobiota bacterium]